VQYVSFGSKGLWDMYFDKNLSGRTEKRLPIMVVVRLAPLEPGKAEEKTYTDNLSPHGVRVCSTQRWRPGDQAEVAPVDQGPPMQGEVVYCEKFDKSRFFVGLRFPEGRAAWRVLQRYAGA
jgi:hypothetical protein